jgi:hypothetical protein
MIQPINEPMLRNSLTKAANFKKEHSGYTTNALPPMDVVRDILSVGAWELPPIEAIVETPVLRPNGTVLDKPGYDPETGLYYWKSAALTLPDIPERPTDRDVANALELLNDSIGDFPFASATCKANTLALMLTPIVRPAIRGTVPLALLDAPQQGSGKTYLAKLIAIIATGRPAAMMAAPDNDEEWRKRITSTLASGVTVITIDNIEGRLSSPSLAGALTVDVWQDRILGASEIIEISQRATWIATGNNIRLGGDLQRRCYWIRLDAKSATPWIGRTFKHPRLLDWVTENRCRLVAALLTLARGWFCAGQPICDSTTIGGFEDWCHTVGSILAFAGVKGFLGNLTSLYAIADEEAAEWEQFLAALEAKYSKRSFTTATLVADLENDPGLPDALPSDLADDWLKRKQGAVNFNRRLGKAFSSRQDRRYGDDEYRLDSPGEAQHAKLWQVVSRSSVMEQPVALVA